jgi:hypothetical protein
MGQNIIPVSAHSSKATGIHLFTVGQAVAISTFHNDYTGLLVLCHRSLPSTAYAKLKHKASVTEEDQRQ